MQKDCTLCDKSFFLLFLFQRYYAKLFSQKVLQEKGEYRRPDTEVIKNFEQVSCSVELSTKEVLKPRGLMVVKMI